MSDSLYQEYILDLYRNPLNKKTLDVFDSTATEYNQVCGDEISVQILFGGDGRVVDIGYQGIGCAISQASISLMTELVKGKSKDEISGLKFDDVKKELGIEIGYTREKCAMIGLKAIQKAVQI